MTSVESEMLKKGDLFLSEGGVETTLVYKYGRSLKEFASFTMFENKEDSELITAIHRSFADVAASHELPIILDIETWRASSVWFDKIGTSQEQQAKIPRIALEKAQKLAQYISEKSNGKSSAIIIGVIGPSSDAYIADDSLDVAGARKYHRAQILALKNAGFGLIAAFTFTTSSEGLGIALEARDAGVPCIIAFTLTISGKLPSGESLRDAITKIDSETASSVLFFGVNCTHPRHMASAIEIESSGEKEGGEWRNRIGIVRGNASLKSHEELENSAELDEGDPVEFAKEMVALREVLPSLKVIGGCCGTSSVHCEEIAKLVKTTQ